MNSSPKFIRPEFGERCLEFRCENNEICVYGTRDGLKTLSDLILRLVERSKEDHIHLEDYELLTKESLVGSVAVFDEEC